MDVLFLRNLKAIYCNGRAGMTVLVFAAASEHLYVAVPYSGIILIHDCVIRTYQQTGVLDFAATAGIPTINALTNKEHAWPILADMFTTEEKPARLRRKQSSRGQVTTSDIRLTRIHHRRLQEQAVALPPRHHHDGER